MRYEFRVIDTVDGEWRCRLIDAGRDGFHLASTFVLGLHAVMILERESRETTP